MKQFFNLKNIPHHKLALASLLVGATSIANASAVLPESFIALESTRTIGNQGFNGSLSMRFDVLSPIKITQLGAFDSNQDGFSSEIKVGIFDRNTQTLVTELATFLGSGSTLIGNSRFIDIADVVLGVGNYSIVAQGFNSANPNGNAGFSSPAPTINNGGGLLQFVGVSYYDVKLGTFVHPLISDSGPANRYDAGTFEYQAFSSVPLPATAWMFGSGLIGLASISRKKLLNS